MDVAVDMLDEDSLTLVLGFLRWTDILKARVCKKWREAARRTTVPQTKVEWRTGNYPSFELLINNRKFANALSWISEALPLVPSLRFDFQISASKEFDIVDGEDSEPDTRFRRREGLPPVDLTPISNFIGLKNLYFWSVDFNGRYPFLFNFRQLESLTILFGGMLKWDLADLSGLPVLKKLCVIHHPYLTGNLKSVIHLRSTLVDLR